MPAATDKPCVDCDTAPRLPHQTRCYRCLTTYLEGKGAGLKLDPDTQHLISLRKSGGTFRNTYRGKRPSRHLKHIAANLYRP
jgi:hypothetical protein